MNKQNQDKEEQYVELTDQPKNWSVITRAAPIIQLKSGERLKLEGEIPKLHDVNFLARGEGSSTYFLMFGLNPAYEGYMVVKRYLELPSMSISFAPCFIYREWGERQIENPENPPWRELFIGDINSMKAIPILREKQHFFNDFRFIEDYYKYSGLEGKIEIAQWKDDKEEEKIVRNYHPILPSGTTNLLMRGIDFDVL